jgi:RNA polymerase sigma-70 factor (ECF subfamily)
MPEQIQPEVLLLLHQRLVGGDRVASVELLELLLSPLMGEMERKFPICDVQLISDGVTDALLDYCNRPGTFDPRRGAPLDRFLAKAAWGNIKNLRRGEARRKAREAKAAETAHQNVVELCPPTGNALQNAVLDTKQGLDELARLLPDPTDQQVFKLKAMGERRTEIFAKAIGITHLPFEQQRREVKRAKDRIDKVMERRKDPRS